MLTILLIKLNNFRKRKTCCTPSHACRKSPERAYISINSSRLTSVLYMLPSKNPTNSNFLKSCYLICFALVGMIKYLFAVLTCYITNFYLDNEKGIKVKSMKQVDDTNLIDNDEICHEEPPYPTNSQMALDFSDSDIKNIMAAL